MVVPNTATIIIKVAPFQSSLGISDANATSRHGTCTVKSTATYDSSARVSHFR